MSFTTKVNIKNSKAFQLSIDSMDWSGINNFIDGDKLFIDGNEFGTYTGTTNSASNGLGLVGLDIRLGGVLNENTNIETNGSTLDFSGNNDGIINIKSQSGTSAGFTDAVGIQFSNLPNGFIAIDNRSTPTGIEYSANYASTYTSRSLVDKGFVESLLNGLDPKEAVNLTTTTSDGNINLGSFSGTLDGITVQSGWRVLIKNQTDPSQNGIYDYNGTSFVRSSDFIDPHVTAGAYTSTISGSTNMGFVYYLVNSDSITVGTSDLNFSVLSRQLDLVESTGIDIVTLNSQRTISVNAGETVQLLTDTNLVSGTPFPISYNGNTLVLDVDGFASQIAGNGINASSDVIELGGSLIKITTINTGGLYGLSIGNAVNASGADSFAIGYNTEAVSSRTFAGGSGTATRKVRASGIGSFNYSSNSASQIVDGGANAPLSGIIGGLDNNIDSSNQSTIILGGEGINVSTGGYTATAIVDNLAIWTAPSDGGTDDVLTFNGTTKKIGKVTQQTIADNFKANIRQSRVITTNTTATDSDDVIIVDSTISVITITLPASPTDGLTFLVKDGEGTALTNNIILDGNTKSIDGGLTTTINTDYGSVEVHYDVTTDKWYSISFTN